MIYDWAEKFDLLLTPVEMVFRHFLQKNNRPTWNTHWDEGIQFFSETSWTDVSSSCTPSMGWVVSSMFKGNEMRSRRTKMEFSWERPFKQDFSQWKTGDHNKNINVNDNDNHYDNNNDNDDVDDSNGQWWKKCFHRIDREEGMTWLHCSRRPHYIQEERWKENWWRTR